MPLPSLPATTTSRYKLTYSVSGTDHSIVCHMATGSVAADAATAGAALANLLKPICTPQVVFNGVQFAALGSNIFNPVSVLSIAGTATGTVYQAKNRPFCGSFTARSSSGRKTRFLLFGVDNPGDVSFRITSIENPAIGTIITGLNSGVGAIAAIDASTTLSWHPYMNVGFHDHWVKVARRG